MVISRARHTYNTMKNQIGFPFGTWNFVKLKPKFFGWMESARGLVLVFFQIGWKGDATFSNQSCNANHFSANNVIIFLIAQYYFQCQERLALGNNAWTKYEKCASLKRKKKDIPHLRREFCNQFTFVVASWGSLVSMATLERTYKKSPG